MAQVPKLKVVDGNGGNDTPARTPVVWTLKKYRDFYNISHPEFKKIRDEIQNQYGITGTEVTTRINQPDKQIVSRLCGLDYKKRGQANMARLLLDTYDEILKERGHNLDTILASLFSPKSKPVVKPQIINARPCTARYTTATGNRLEIEFPLGSEIIIAETNGEIRVRAVTREPGT